MRKAILLLTTATAAAASQLGIDVSLNFNPLPPNPPVCFHGSSSGTSATFDCPFATYFYTHNPDLFVGGSGSVSATADYGKLGGLASGGIGGNDNFLFAFGSVVATSVSFFSDTMTIVIPGIPTGTPAMHTLYFHLFGNSSAQATGGDRAIFTEQLQVDSPAGLQTFVEAEGVVDQIFSVQFPIELGVPFGFGATLGLVAGVQGFGSGPPQPPRGVHDGSVGIDFSHTAQLVGMQLVLGNQTLDPSLFVAMSESGTAYPTGSPASSGVPEPCTLLLIAAGMVTLRGFLGVRTH